MSEEEPAARPVNEEREARVLDAAARLIIHFGYDKTTVSDIAREARVSKGAIYLHFASKEALFEALLWRESLRYMDDWITRIEADPDAGTFIGLYQTSLQALFDNDFMLAIARRDRHVVGSYMLNEERMALLQLKFMNQRQMLEVFREAGVIRQDVDINIMAYIMGLMVYGFLKMDEMILPEHAPPFDVVIEMMFNMFGSYLAPPDGGDREAGKRIVRKLAAGWREQIERLNNGESLESLQGISLEGEL